MKVFEEKRGSQISDLEQHGFNQEMLHVNRMKNETYDIDVTSARDMMTIDKEISRALQKGKNGLSESLR